MYLKMSFFCAIPSFYFLIGKPQFILFKAVNVLAEL